MTGPASRTEAHSGPADPAALDAETEPVARRAVEPLRGFTIGITAARRREELGAALERRGAAVRYGPAIRIIPVTDDTELEAATQACLSEPLDFAVMTTGIGYRGWVEAADTWGLGEALLDQLGRATVLARGPKVRGAVRASGLREAWSPDSESTVEVLEHLLAGGSGDVAGKRIAVQLHGEPLPGMVESLAAAGAHVIEVPVYRWAPPEDEEPLLRLIDAVLDGEVQALAFTSAPASLNFLRTATEVDKAEAVIRALGEQVTAFCVGPVTAAPLERAGIPVVVPGRFRLGALVREIVLGVPARFATTVQVCGRVLEIRAQGAVLDDSYVGLPPSSVALLQLLAERQGGVVSRQAMLDVMPGDGGQHAVEVAIARLRAALGDPDLVQTVVKRGYRLAATG